MEALGLLGAKLNTLGSKVKLRRVFLSLQKNFSPVFNPIPQPWKEKCLAAIT